MNYFEGIQEISAIFRGYQPSAFADISNKKYNLVKEAYKSAAKSIYTHRNYDFKKKDMVLTTVDGQDKYKNIYGLINDILIPYDSTNENRFELKYIREYKDMLLLAEATDEDRPYYVTQYGEEIIFWPTPDGAYSVRVLSDQDKWAKSVGTVDQSSASGQVNLYITKTEGFTAGSTILIAPNTPNEETAVISSVVSDDYLVLTANLTNTHAVGVQVEYYKESFDYELDEPNFPSKYHDAISYKALTRLYFDDQPNLIKYTSMFYDEMKFIRKNSRGNKKNTTFFKRR